QGGEDVGVGGVHAVAEWQVAPGEPGAGPARNARHAELDAGPQHALPLRFRLGQRHHHGKAAIGGQPVAFVRPRVLFLPQDGALGQELAQATHDLALAREVYLVRRYGAAHVNPSTVSPAGLYSQPIHPEYPRRSTNARRTSALIAAVPGSWRPGRAASCR